MRPPRPKNLNLFTLHFPLPAIISILHRASGVVLFLLIPLLLWALNYSLTDYGYESFQSWAHMPSIQLLFWLLLIPFLFHLLAGIRHLISDIGIGDTLRGGRLSAIIVVITSFVLILLAGIWLW